MNKFQILRIIFILVVGLGLSAYIASTQFNKENESALVASNFGGDYSLNNHLGERVTQDDFSDQYRLLYFGFTYCPVICPTELQRMTQVVNQLPEAIAAQIKPMFVTIDPDRDNTTTIKNYISAFHPNFVGLTGTQEEIDVIKDGYKIYAVKMKDETMTEYTMDHSSYIYFMGPNDDLFQIFKIDDSIDYMADKITKRLH